MSSKMIFCSRLWLLKSVSCLQPNWNYLTQSIKQQRSSRFWKTLSWRRQKTQRLVVLWWKESQEEKERELQSELSWSQTPTSSSLMNLLLALIPSLPPLWLRFWEIWQDQEELSSLLSINLILRFSRTLTSLCWWLLEKLCTSTQLTNQKPTSRPLDTLSLSYPTLLISTWTWCRFRVMK